ncbi:Tetratricopeptide repeat superfamily protein [Perilla frutescens var. hirtella]|uniref:Tetratricopeptide repeat superfamily protein n=1 Tax=Perilla frutescens var. hirtella TaxID=608512 RepID=A0AAD4IWW0_PERFH|nr:Tetratricopeptide repeat superfamily protein [Perilla frutescens var. hirtella]
MFFRQAIIKLCKGLRNSASLQIKTYNYLPNAGKLIVSSNHDFGGHTRTKCHLEILQWLFLSGQAAYILGTSSSPSMAEDVSAESRSKNGTSADDFSGLRKVEDDSMISNEHTSKWRVFTDNGRDYFLKGNVDQAEKFFLSALQEAKEGFGERDPHVASACNNLAELYRVKKDFDKAEPLYVEAINILEDYFGVNDVRVGAALHNLGTFYLVQRKLENARVCYEIKRRVLGEAHTEYADTMYHLGTVLYLQGKEKDAEDLIVDSIDILEAGGQGQSILCIRRMQYLAQIYNKSNRFAEAENLLRKILHMMELSKGWKSLDTVVVAERLALTLEASGRLKEAVELLERCLDARKNLLRHEHIQSAADMLYIARMKMLVTKQLPQTDNSQAVAELDKAKSLLNDSVRIARKLLVRFQEQKGKKEPFGVSRKTGKDGHSAAVILLQSLNALGSLEIMKQEFLGSREHILTEANAALRQCISTFQELRSEHSISDFPEVKAEYLWCLRRLHHLISNGTTSKVGEVKEIEDEIQRVEAEISNAGNS